MAPKQFDRANRRARTTKLRIVKAAESTYYESSVRYGQEEETESNVRCTRYFSLDGEISVCGDTVIEQEVLEASRNTLMARAPGKYEITLHTCISITEKAKFNEQNKSIAVGPFYIGTDFEPIWTLLPEDVAVLNARGIGPCNVGTPHV